MDPRQAYALRRQTSQPWQAWYKTARWRKLRARQLRAEPMCCMCQQRGIDRAATVCNHVVRHQGDYDLFWSGPFSSLCANCHNSDMQRIEGGGTARPVVGIDGWPSDRA
jgi:5-methylcytosine-specific restriction enzyme A